MKRTNRSPSQQLIGYLMVITAATLFGFNGTLSRILFDSGVTTVTLAEFRMLIGGLCLLVVLLVGQRRSLRLPRRSWGWMVAFGIALAMVTYTYFSSISLLPIAIALVIEFSAPAWMVLGESIWRRRMPSRYILSALGLTISGIILLTELWRQNLNGLSKPGLLYAALSVVTYIVYLVIGKRVGRDVPAMTTTTYGAFVASAFWLIIQPPWAIPASTWSPERLPLILLVGVFGMAIPFALLLASLRRLEASRVALAGMLELVAGGAIAYFWLGQLLDIWQICGCVLILAGITLVQYESVSGKQREASTRGAS